MLVLLGLKYFEKDDTKNLHSDVYQADAPLIREYSLVSLLEKRKKNVLTLVIWDSLTQPNFSNHPMQAWVQGCCVIEKRLDVLFLFSMLSGLM